MLPTICDWINKTINYSDAAWNWVYQKIRHESNHTKNLIYSKTKCLPCCYQRCSIASTKKMNESDLVWRWVHQKYPMSQIIRKLCSIKNTNDLTFLFPMMFDIIYETIKIIIYNIQTAKIIINSTIMYFSINFYNFKLLYPYQ